MPLLQKDKLLCITGSSPALGSFDPANPTFFLRGKNKNGTIKISISEDDLPLSYKLAVYDKEKNSITEYEPGENRIINTDFSDEPISITIPGNFLLKYLWKGAGINIPLFSVRSQKDWGCGDFSSLHLLADHAAAYGMKLIQLLPLNDTTATFTDKDSYPYSAISAFALHPLYMDVQQLAVKYEENIFPEEKEQTERLNALPAVDYTGVMQLKTTVLRRLFIKDNRDFQSETKWLRFFKKNREWLTGYAVFCVLRDQYGTAKFSQSVPFNEEKVLRYASPESEAYDEISFHYFVQYHLHLQLKAAVRHANTKGLLLKADLPIGVGRYSADTWQYRDLFHMNMQAGAPPDAFSEKGQNWNFPTYNMEAMRSENFRWFRKKLQHLGRYFDAVRIDHVLGFFRIWSIPVEFADGRMGRFVPAKGLSAADFNDAGIRSDEKRLTGSFNADDLADVILFKTDTGFHFRINMQHTTSYSNLPAAEKASLDKLYEHYFFERQQELWKAEGKEKLQMLRKATDMLLCAEDLGMVPDFVPGVLHDTNMLSLRVMQMPDETNSFFSDPLVAPYASVVMPATHDMPPVRLWWEQHRDLAHHLYKEELHENGNTPYFCEPWICKKIAEIHLQSPAMWSIFLMQDLLAINGLLRRPIPAEERINDPANAAQVWNYRMHISIEQLLGETAFNTEVKNMIRENGR